MCTLLVVLPLDSFGRTFHEKQPYKLLPAPQQIVYETGIFQFGKQIKVSFPETLSTETKQLEAGLKAQGYRFKKSSATKCDVKLVLDKNLSSGKKNGYVLTVRPDQICIVGIDKTGVFYGIQTLLQLMRFNLQEGQLRCGTVTDYPAYSWRAFMLDEARHFKGKKVVCSLLDRMAEMKMNIFHWHLTDHQGWRIEIKQYPKLTEVGAYRDSSMLGHWKSNKYDGKPHSGFYTQKEIKEIIRYAQDRHITILPEIDMPGHSSAAIAAYPEIGSSGKAIKVPCKFGPQYEVYDVTRPEVVRFLKNVLTEVIALFPSPIIHIGGDEVRFNQWNESATIQQYMKDHHIQSPAELQLQFTNELSTWIEQQGRRMMGWNEITGEKLHEYHTADTTKVSGTLAKNSIVHFWKGEPKLITKAIKNGHDIVNSYHIFTYLDYSYKQIPLQKAYDFQPTPAGLTKQEQQHVLGLGCQMWGEFIPTVKDMNRQVFPRIAAYAEVGWTDPSKKDFTRFTQSLEKLSEYWEQFGIQWNK